MIDCCWALRKALASDNAFSGSVTNTSNGGEEECRDSGTSVGGVVPFALSPCTAGTQD